MSTYQAPEKMAVIYTPEVTNMVGSDCNELSIFARSCTFERFRHHCSEIICPTADENPDEVVEKAINTFGQNGVLVVALNGEGKRWGNKVDQSALISLSKAQEIHNAQWSRRFQHDHWGI